MVITRLLNKISKITFWKVNKANQLGHTVEKEAKSDTKTINHKIIKNLKYT